MNLLVDMGNSRIKWGLEQQGRLSKLQWLNNEQLSHAELVKRWQGLPEPRSIAIACVNAMQCLKTVLAVVAELWPVGKVCIAQSQVDGFGVRNAYRQPEKLGVDRWLALVAARQDLQPVCVVDCGTAITLDLLDGEGQHLGGLICPGLTLMKQALSDGTQALAFDGREFALKPADFTEAAIDSGTLFAAIGLVEAVLARQPEGFKIILTGGDALRIAGGLKLRHQVDDALVLRGLALILKGLR